MLLFIMSLPIAAKNSTREENLLSVVVENASSINNRIDYEKHQEHNKGHNSESHEPCRVNSF